MSALGSLVVKLALEYAEYTKGLDKASQESMKFAQGWQKSFDTAAATSKEFFTGLAAGAIATVGAYAGVSATIDRLSNSIDVLAKLDDAAQKTGSSVENLSRIQQTVVAFSHDFNLIDTSIAKLAKGMATFDSETNYTSRALKALGVESRDAAGKLRDPSQVMIEIAKNLQNFEDGAAKSALVTDLFGKSGAQLLPILNDLADNVDRYKGVTAAAAAEASQFQDQLGAVRGRVDEVFTSFTSGLLPSLIRVTGSTHDAGDGMDFFSRAGRGVGSMIEWLLEKGSKAWTMFGMLGDILSTRASQLQALVKGDFHEIGQLEKNLDMLQGKRLAEHKHYVSQITGGNQKIEESVKKVKSQLNYQTGTPGTDEAAKKIEQLNEASRKYLETLKTETVGVGASSIQTKMLAAAKQAAITPSKELAMAIMTEAQAWGRLAQFQQDAKDEFAALEEREDAFRNATGSIEDYARATDLANGSAQFELELMGKTAQERDVALAQRQAELELKKQILAITDQVTNADDRAALIEEANAISERAIAAAKLQAAAKSTGAEWARIGQSIEQTGKMAFIQFAAHGVGAAKSIGQALKLSVIDLIYELTARPIFIRVQASLANSFASGIADAAGSALGKAGGVSGAVSGSSNAFNLMNIASGVKSVFSAFTGGAARLVGAIGTSSLGVGLGLGTAGGSALGAGVGAGAGAGTAFIGGAGTALGGTGATVAGLSSMGAMMAAAAGPLAIAAAADMIFRLIAGNKTIKGAEALTYVPVIGPLINALFGMGPKKLGPSELTGKFSDSGFAGQFEADWTRKGGLFAFGKKKGRRGLGISAEQDAALDAMVGDISGAFLSLTKTTGDAGRTLAGWTFQVKQAIDTEEQQAELTKNLSNSIGEKLIPELTLIQQKGEELADTAARAGAEFTLINALLDLTGKTLAVTGLASLGLRDSLVQLLGGIENAGSALQPFFENFYTDAERVASTGRLMNAELAKLGITTIPTTREQFRALVEAQDLNTTSGQKMFAALIQLAPAFVTVTDAIAKAADDAAAEAKRIADSIQLLTTDAFATLFDYTKYIRLAANAGVTAAQPAGPVFQAPGQVFLPGFASGSNEIPHDMTARIHKGERILPAADNRELMRRLSNPGAANDALVSEIKQLRAELKAAHLAISMNTSKTARSTEKLLGLNEEWHTNGLPPERAA